MNMLRTVVQSDVVLTVREAILPSGYIGFWDHEPRVIWVHAQSSRRQKAETLLLEVLHCLLDHTGPQPPDLERAIESLCTRVAATLRSPVSGLGLALEISRVCLPQRLDRVAGQRRQLDSRIATLCFEL